uniref:Uncharacterized protein n=1 Tax=Mus musculus TaxID=10090 RepID=Q3V2M6_MOUSE|nr:unnamed protein product [Mus musculus]
MFGKGTSLGPPSPPCLRRAAALLQACALGSQATFSSGSPSPRGRR